MTVDALSDLNDEQRRAAAAGDGPVAIIAGPGTGKTKTLTARIAFLVASGRAKPEEILALTYTNKAAKEMQTRASSLLPQIAQPHITTFHALCFELLQHAADRHLQLIAEHERMVLIRGLKHTAALKQLTSRELAAAISSAKNLPIGSRHSDPTVQRVTDEYNTALRERNLLDFDDLLQQVHEQLRTSTIIRNKLQQRYRYVLVDEFQDTGELQYQLLQLLASHGNLFVIGDPLQSIYGFRGASAAIFERFKTDFPHHLEITLKINYRSAPEIVQLANVLFPQVSSLVAHQDSVGSVRAVEVFNEYAEAEYIIRTIEQRFGGTDFMRSHHLSQDNMSAQNTPAHFSDFAILYRTHRSAAPLERALAESGIPFQIVGDGSPYETPAVQTIVQLMRYQIQPTEPTFSQLRSLKTLKEYSANQLKTLLAHLPGAEQPPSTLAARIAETFGLDNTTEATARTIRQFVNHLIRFDTLSLAETLAALDATAEQGFYDARADAITLLTIHASKGLEFEHVLLIGAEDGLLPHRSGKRNTEEHDTETHLAEERRLCYVAATRARSTLTLLHARFRGGQPAHISPFIADLPAHVCTRSVDPALIHQLRKHRVRQQKRAQTTLF